MLFIVNKYTNTYNNIIERAIHRDKPDMYTEKHHIIPKSLGGSDSKDNIVDLTAREHFVCHLLLTKMTKGLDRQKMVYAVNFLCKTSNGGKTGGRRISINNRTYERLSIEQSILAREAQSKRTLTDETKLKISKSLTGRIVSSDTREKLSRSRTGIKYSIESRKNISEGRKNGKKAEKTLCVHCNSSVDPGNYSQWHGENCYVLTGECKTLTSAHKIKISKANKGRTLPKIQCSNCLKLVDGGNYRRWHGDNCKYV